MSMGAIRTAPMSVPFNMHVGREGFNPPLFLEDGFFSRGLGKRWMEGCLRTAMLGR